jgi:hypothetical protein
MRKWVAVPPRLLGNTRKKADQTLDPDHQLLVQMPPRALQRHRPESLPAIIGIRGIAQMLTYVWHNPLQKPIRSMIRRGIL